MSLRRSIFLAVVGAVVLVTLLEGLLDVGGEAIESLLPPGRAGAPWRLVIDLMDIPLFVLIGVLLATWLSRRIARPLSSLAGASREMAALGKASAVSVPPGEDALTELVRSFNEMARAVDSHVERERAFTRYASHELRTPLSAIRLQVERARLGHVDPDETLAVVDKNLRQMQEVLDALLALARSSEHAAERRPLGHVIEETLVSLPEASRSRVTVRGLFGGAYVSHPRIVQQAVANLVDNALRHGGGFASLRIAVGDRGLTVRVSDQGPGVPPASLPRLTEPFYRLGNDRQGLGLGLAFVAHVARALGGELDLANTESGLEATLRLPVVAAPT